MRSVFCTRAQVLCLIIFAWFNALSTPASGRNSAKVPSDIDLPASFDVDFKLASKQRSEISLPSATDDASAETAADVLRSLVDSPTIAGFGLPYKWTFRVFNSPQVNAGSLPDGEIETYTGMTRIVGSNRGLWAAILSHEVAHVARRHGVKKFLYHEYIEEQIRYLQMRAYYGDKSAGWAIIGLRVGGAIGEKKLSRDLEHDADKQGMLLMARAGYHPDYVFAMHHLLRIETGEQSKFGAFFSDHPRWETRDQRTEKAYLDAVAEYNRLWPNPAASPGGVPPTVVFLDSVHGEEDKQRGTGDLILTVSCRNVVGPVALSIHLAKGDGSPVPSSMSEYRDAAGSVAIRQYSVCFDKDVAVPTVVHIPSEVVPENERKLKAQVDFFGPDDELLERSKSFDVHFPKARKGGEPAVARVYVGDSPPDLSLPQPMESPARLPVGALAPAPDPKPVASTTSMLPAPDTLTLLATNKELSSTEQGHLTTVSITSDQEGADVFVDSSGAGRVPTTLRLKPGTHTIQVTKPGYKDWVMNVTVEDGLETTLNAKLEK